MKLILKTAIVFLTVFFSSGCSQGEDFGVTPDAKNTAAEWQYYEILDRWDERESKVYLSQLILSASEKSEDLTVGDVQGLENLFFDRVILGDYYMFSYQCIIEEVEEDISASEFVAHTKFLISPPFKESSSGDISISAGTEMKSLNRDFEDVQTFPWNSGFFEVLIRNETQVVKMEFDGNSVELKGLDRFKRQIQRMPSECHSDGNISRGSGIP